jgi:hypothetical protein
MDMIRSPEKLVDFRLNIWRRIPDATSRHIVSSAPEPVRCSYLNYTAFVLFLESSVAKKHGRVIGCECIVESSGNTDGLGVQSIPRNFICMHQKT